MARYAKLALRLAQDHVPDGPRSAGSAAWPTACIAPGSPPAGDGPAPGTVTEHAHGYDVVADAMLAEGVDVLFGLLGNTNLALAAVLAGRGVRFVGGRHETGAVSMAAGHAWASGRPAACTVTHGPGLSNALTGLTAAVMDRHPIVLLVADIRAEPAWSAQRVDHHVDARLDRRRRRRLRRPEPVCGRRDRRLPSAAARRAPVVVNIRAELLAREAVPQSGLDGADPRRQRPANPSRRPVERAACHRCGRRPAADPRRPRRAVGRRGSGPATLAARTGALLATSLPAKGLFARRSVSTSVSAAATAARRPGLVAGSDLVLVLASASTATRRTGTRCCAARTSSTAICRPAPDARLGSRGTPGRPPRRCSPLSTGRAPAGVGPISRRGSPRRRLRRRRRRRRSRPTRRPAGRRPGAAGGSAGRHRRRALHDLPEPAGRRADGGWFLPALGFGSVGLSVATGIGAALGRAGAHARRGRRRRPLMSLGELETVGRVGAPVTCWCSTTARTAPRSITCAGTGCPRTWPCSRPATSPAWPGRSAWRRATWERGDDIEALAGGLPTDRPMLVDARITRSVVAGRFARAGG